MEVYTSDYKTCKVPIDVCKRSGILKFMLDEFANSGPVPLPKVDSETLCHLISDAELTDLSTLFKVAVAADFLDMKDSLDRYCKKIAELLGGKSPKEIRSLLNISSNNITG